MPSARDKKYDNIINYRAMPLIENYWGEHYASYVDENDKIRYEEIPSSFQYADGTSDSYVKRGFDEELVQRMTRRYNLERNYRIFVSSPTIDFKPRDKVVIGETTMTIVKVLPLLNTNDVIRHYNFGSHMYRRMAVKLVYLE